LVKGTDGNFYGTTVYGGTGYNGSWSSGYGTVFQVTFNGRLTSLYSFTCGNDGALPCAGLVQGKDGNFYGATSEGGLNNAGTVFKITSGGALTTLYSFTGGDDGDSPTAAPIQGRDGYLYGTTQSGGMFDAAYWGDGTVFRISTNGAFTTLASFDGWVNGATPMGALMQGSDGDFYGTTEGYGPGGDYGYGTVFRMTPAGSITTIYSFNGTDGAWPQEGLVQDADGYFYGTTAFGGRGFSPSGSLGSGTIYWFPMQPVLETAIRTPGLLALNWSAVPGLAYQVQYKTNFTQTNWTDLGSTITATNGTMTAFDSIASGSSQRFYRVALLP
jgi:uncharacterized repeat protein (TIGR03803 family)